MVRSRQQTVAGALILATPLTDGSCFSIEIHRHQALSSDNESHRLRMAASTQLPRPPPDVAATSGCRVRNGTDKARLGGILQ